MTTQLTFWQELAQTGLVALLTALVPLLVGVTQQRDSRGDKIARYAYAAFGAIGVVCIAVAALGGIWS